MIENLVLVPAPRFAVELLGPEAGDACPTRAFEVGQPRWTLFRGQRDALPSALVLRWEGRACVLSTARLLFAVANFEVGQHSLRTCDFGAEWTRGTSSWHLVTRCRGIRYTDDKHKAGSGRVYVPGVSLDLPPEVALTYVAAFLGLGQGIQQESVA